MHVAARRNSCSSTYLDRTSCTHTRTHAHTLHTGRLQDNEAAGVTACFQSSTHIHIHITHTGGCRTAQSNKSYSVCLSRTSCSRTSPLCLANHPLFSLLLPLFGARLGWCLGLGDQLRLHQVCIHRITDTILLHSNDKPVCCILCLVVVYVWLIGCSSSCLGWGLPPPVRARVAVCMLNR